MTLTHLEARDHLEAYALWALDERERAAVEAHLAACDACRAEARELAGIVDAIPEAILERSPSPALRGRVLDAAKADLPRPARRAWLPTPGRAWAVSLALVVATVAAGGTALHAQQQLDAVRADYAKYEAIAEKVSQGGRWWYMAGVASFDGSGGTLIDPNTDRQAFVLFHDLKALPAGERYTIWMIRSDGSWVRTVNFAPSGDALQRVDVPLAVADFVQCAVTVETADSGPRAGPVAMQSRVFGQ